MKAIILVLMCVAFSASYTYATEVPAAVKAAFESKYPGATNVSWEKEGAHEYEAEFRLNGNKYSAKFSDTGDWLESHSRIDFAKVPDKVSSAFKKAYRDVKAETVYLVEKAKGNVDYEIEVKKNGKVEKVYYTSDGQIRKK